MPTTLTNHEQNKTHTPHHHPPPMEETKNPNKTTSLITARIQTYVNPVSVFTEGHSYYFSDQPDRYSASTVTPESPPIYLSGKKEKKFFVTISLNECYI